MEFPPSNESKLALIILLNNCCMPALVERKEYINYRTSSHLLILINSFHIRSNFIVIFFLSRCHLMILK